MTEFTGFWANFLANMIENLFILNKKCLFIPEFQFLIALYGLKMKFLRNCIFTLGEQRKTDAMWWSHLLVEFSKIKVRKPRKLIFLMPSIVRFINKSVNLINFSWFLNNFYILWIFWYSKIWDFLRGFKESWHSDLIFEPYVLVYRTICSCL